MAINFDSALGIHADALTLRARRAEVIANNIANADTPNFKARDIDFRAVLSGAMDGQQSPLKMAVTQDGHKQQLADPDFAADLMFRNPLQPAVDGNTVEVQEEMARYTDNALRYQASFEFLNSKFSGLRKAVKGE
ncbi:flagellar basal body rod protein FlgB [Nitrincola sp.]|uniref:flagellar basal body rod protein FlgB n=1 Tax=Nitrincola sp. TaxID=1926584 RepID=UPI003A8F5CC2